MRSRLSERLSGLLGEARSTCLRGFALYGAAWSPGGPEVVAEVERCTPRPGEVRRGLREIDSYLAFHAECF